MDNLGKKQTLGRWGEERAAEYLTGMGYQIIARNFRGNYGEIDLIARDNSVLCFIEVKTRHQDRFGCGIDAITLRKQKRVIRAAYAFLSEQGIYDEPMRFDVVSIDKQQEGYRFTLIQNAFVVMEEKQ